MPPRKTTTRRCGPQQRMSPYAKEKCSVNKTKSAGSPPTISEQSTEDISAILRSYVTKLPEGLQSKAFDAAGKFVAILELTSNTPSNSTREPRGKNQGRIPQTTENPEPPKSNNDNGVVFSKDAPLTLLDFSQHLGLPRAARLVADISAILQILPDRDPVGLPCQFQFNRSGLWVGEWINLVVQHCPQVFQLSDHYLKNSALVNLQNIHQLLKSPTPNDLQFAESLFLRVAEGFLKPGPLAKNGIAHTVFAAMIVAATKAPFNSLPESLSCYVEGTFYESFVTRVKSIVTAIQALRDSKRNKSLQLSALACFMVAGVRGLFLGPLTPRACPSSGASQHIHFIALTGTVPADIEPFWYGSFDYICHLIRTNSNGNSEEVSEVRLARELSQDFLRNWSIAKQPVPWLKSRMRKCAPPPSIDLNCI